MKTFLFFTGLLMLVSCDEESRAHLIDKSTTSLATVSYAVNSTNLINDQKTFSLSSLINFLVLSANINEWRYLGPISLQSISLELSVNSNNKAEKIRIKTSISNRNCAGSLSTFAPFSIDRTIPLQDPVFGINIPVAVSVTLSPEGVALLNTTLRSALPLDAKYYISPCGDILFKLDGNVEPANLLASLNLKVIIRYNIEYSECVDNPFLNAIRGSHDNCNE